MPSSLSQCLDEAIAALQAVSSTPRLDAEVLLMQATGLGRTGLITHGEQVLSPDHYNRLQELLRRRLAGEPVAYLTGYREFWSLALKVSPAVLIPRPETELLVEQALCRIPQGAELRIADLGTGSGAVALAIAAERPRCRLIATDMSPEALAVAQRNARELHLDNIEFRLGDWLTPLAGETLDLIVSNPPYVAEQDRHLSEGDVRFEPRQALVSGPDGLDAIRGIVSGAAASLRPGGWLMLEHGHDQAAALESLLRQQGCTEISLHLDLAGIPRVTVARLKNPGG